MLFNPNAFAVSEHVKNELSLFDELEFLPVHIDNHGVFHVLHVTAAIELPTGSKVRIAPPPSGNIVRIQAFPRAFEPQFSFFRVLQPEGSAARERLASTRAVYLSVVGARALTSCAGGYFAALEMAGA